MRADAAPRLGRGARGCRLPARRGARRVRGGGRPPRIRHEVFSQEPLGFDPHRADVWVFSPREQHLFQVFDCSSFAFNEVVDGETQVYVLFGAELCGPSPCQQLVMELPHVWSCPSGRRLSAAEAKERCCGAPLVDLADAALVKLLIPKAAGEPVPKLERVREVVRADGARLPPLVRVWDSLQRSLSTELEAELKELLIQRCGCAV